MSKDSWRFFDIYRVNDAWEESIFRRATVIRVAIFGRIYSLTIGRE